MSINESKLFKKDIDFDPRRLSKPDVYTKGATQPPPGTIIKIIDSDITSKPLKTDINTKSGQYNAPMEILNNDLRKEESGSVDTAVVSTTLHDGQIIVFKSAPKPPVPPVTPKPPPEKKQEGWFDRFWRSLTEKGKPAVEEI
jgi:hypothetical protein